MAYRICGWHSVRLPIRYDYDQGLQFVKTLDPPSSAPNLTGKYGDLKQFGIEWLDTQLSVLGLSPPSCLTRNSYFPPGEAACASPALGDFVVDGGACFGDAALMFGAAVGPKGRVFSFEPVESHLEVAYLNLEINPELPMEILEAGLAHSCRQTGPVRFESYHPGFRATDQTPLCKLDDTVDDREIEKVDYIKLDIEGFELAALQGAQGPDEKFKPKLAICLYHKPEDMFMIPLWIKNTFPKNDYRFFLDHHSLHSEETVLYVSQ